MLTELQAAGCAFSIEISGGRRIQPRNLLDLDLPGEAADTVWRITVLSDPGVQHPAPPGWSGSAGQRSFHGDGFVVEFKDRTAQARHDPSRAGAAFAAAQAAVFSALRRESRADLHAAAIVPTESAGAIVLVGESGHGKSTLTLRAITAGWGFLSDDLIAVFNDDAGALALAPLRRTLRVAESAFFLLPETARAGQWNTETPRKMIVDPEACGLGHRHSRARPGRLVFLERGDSKRSRTISGGASFERLMLHSPHLAFDPDAKPAIEALRRLANEVPAAIASLTLDSLHDVATLEDLLA